MLNEVVGIMEHIKILLGKNKMLVEKTQIFKIILTKQKKNILRQGTVDEQLFFYFMRMNLLMISGIKQSYASLPRLTPLQGSLIST